MSKDFLSERGTGRRMVDRQRFQDLLFIDYYRKKNVSKINYYK